MIFPAAKARELAPQCSRISPGPVTDVWTPANADIDAMEPALAKLLASKLAAVDGGHYATAGDYYRQYAGLVIGGRRIIYAGGVHKSAVMDNRPEYRDLWRRQAVTICDGGPIVFGVEYNPTTKTFANFAFNGPG